MSETICRPFITLRNGKVLYAHDVGLRAFCFEVDEVKPRKQKTPIHVVSKIEASENIKV